MLLFMSIFTQNKIRLLALPRIYKSNSDTYLCVQILLTEVAFVLQRKTNSKISIPIYFHYDVKILFWNTSVWGDFGWSGNMFVDSICPRFHDLNTSSSHRLLHNSGPREIPRSSLQGLEPISLCFAFRLCRKQLGNIQKETTRAAVFFRNYWELRN